MRTVAGEGARSVSLGLAPLSGEVAWWLRAARRLGRPFYHFEGLAAFKRKLRPDRWRPIYMVYPAGGCAMVALADSLRAFADGSLLRFALRTAARFVTVDVPAPHP
jgi:phosphatidylglycerol lysyltransferase